MQIALFLGAMGGLLSDAIGSGYIYVLYVAGALILYTLYDEYMTKSIYLKPQVSVPVVFNISNSADTKSALRSLTGILQNEYPEHLENLEKYFNIIEQDLIFKYDGDIFNEDRLIDFLKICKHDLKKLEAKTPKSVHFHIVYIGPASVAILIGTLFGTDAVTLYQYSNSSDTYNISIEINNREHKKAAKENRLTYIEYINKNDSDSVTVAIDAASHKVALGALEGEVIHIESKVGSTLETAEEFIQMYQEIYTLLNSLQQTKKDIKLVYSMPVTLGFLLGLNIQTYWNIEVTQFVQGKYKSVVDNISKINYYF